MYICARPRSFKKINMKNKKLTINENPKKNNNGNEQSVHTASCIHTHTYNKFQQTKKKSI